jgi:hypothetical protein
VDENQFICIGIFIKYSVKDFFGAARPMVQSLLTSIALRLSRKSSAGFNSKPLSNNDYIYLRQF